VATEDPLDTDWIHGVFEVLREELVAISADFGDRVKREVDLVAASQTIRPPSAIALLTSVTVETANFAGSLLQRPTPRTAPTGPDDDDSDPNKDDA